MPEVFNAASTKKGQNRKRTKKENVTSAEDFSSVLRDETSGGKLAAFCPKPEHVTFEIQHDDEPILLLLRQHPITNLGWIVTVMFLLALPLLLRFIGFYDWLPATFQFVTMLGWYTIIIGYGLEKFLMWFFNIYIVTDERVIDVDFYNLLFKRISEAKLENIEDITFSNSGILQSIIDYGEVRIQTAAEIPQIEFENVPHPEKVAKFLSEMLLQEEQEKLEGRVR